MQLLEYLMKAQKNKVKWLRSASLVVSNSEPTRYDLFFYVQCYANKAVRSQRKNALSIFVVNDDGSDYNWNPAEKGQY